MSQREVDAAAEDIEWANHYARTLVKAAPVLRVLETDIAKTLEMKLRAARIDERTAATRADIERIRFEHSMLGKPTP